MPKSGKGHVAHPHSRSLGRWWENAKVNSVINMAKQTGSLPKSLSRIKEGSVSEAVP